MAKKKTVSKKKIQEQNEKTLKNRLIEVELRNMADRVLDNLMQAIQSENEFSFVFALSSGGNFEKTATIISGGDRTVQMGLVQMLEAKGRLDYLKIVESHEKSNENDQNISRSK